MRSSSVLVFISWAANALSFSPIQSPLFTGRIAIALDITSGDSFSTPIDPPDPSSINKIDNERHRSVFSDEVRQLLGIRDAAENTEKWMLRLQLLKPITWIPLSLVAMCGAAASGNYHWIWNPFNASEQNPSVGIEDALKGFAVALLAGPFSVGFAQTINDWYDRDIDAINEPQRPIPSGAITQEEVFQQLWFLFLGGLLLATGIDQWAMHDFPTIAAVALYGYFVSYIYSAPPLKLKQNGWTGAWAIGTCYISLPWWCGQSVFGSLETPIDWVLPLFLSFLGLGGAIVNDFKSIEGDKAFGMKSIPILLGIEAAKYVAAFVPDLVQLVVAAYLYSIGDSFTAVAIVSLVLPQLFFQYTLLFPDPLENDVKYMAVAQPFLFLSVLATALSVGNYHT